MSLAFIHARSNRYLMSLIEEKIRNLTELGWFKEEPMSRWELIDHDGGEGETKRLPVHNGWLIVNRWKAPDGLWLQSLHYFKDEEFKWQP